MKSLITPDIYLEACRESFTLWAARDFPGADAEMITVIKAFNELNDFATLDSCCGHPGTFIKPEHADKESHRPHLRGGTLYVNMLVNENGVARFFDIFERLNDIVIEEGYKNRFSVQIRKRGIPQLLQFKLGHVRSSVLGFRVGVRHRGEMVQMIETILKAIRSHTEEYQQ